MYLANEEDSKCFEARHFDDRRGWDRPAPRAHSWKRYCAFIEKREREEEGSDPLQSLENKRLVHGPIYPEEGWKCNPIYGIDPIFGRTCTTRLPVPSKVVVTTR